MPHMIWKGAISFGLVHVPVRLFPATSPQKVGFNLLDKRTMDPVGYRQYNKSTGKDVTRENIVRGFPYEKGKYVVLSDEEIRAAYPDSTQTIDILAFVAAPEVSFFYLDTPYVLTPDRGGEKVYALLREALTKSGKIGIASVVLHNKQHLAALVPVGAALALNTLHWSAEVHDVGEFDLPQPDSKRAVVAARELEMALRLIDDMTEPWDPGEYHDTFQEQIMSLVERKVKAGKTEEVETTGAQPAKPRSADVLDLSDLLRRSLARGKGGEGGASGNDKGRAGARGGRGGDGRRAGGGRDTRSRRKSA
jgi:DNA end-binding protein Ku